MNHGHDCNDTSAVQTVLRITRADLIMRHIGEARRQGETAICDHITVLEDPRCRDLASEAEMSWCLNAKSPARALAAT